MDNITDMQEVTADTIRELKNRGEGYAAQDVIRVRKEWLHRARETDKLYKKKLERKISNFKRRDYYESYREKRKKQKSMEAEKYGV